jgi:nicotinate phosphoribosyltransferase
MSKKYHVAISDSDLYKFTQQLAICQLYPNIINHYEFINRDNREFPDGFAKRLEEIVDAFRAIYLTKDEKNFFREKCYYMNPVYLDFLSGYRYDPTEVHINQEGPKLKMFIEGPAYRTVLWEVPLMETISELYFEMTGQLPWVEQKRHARNEIKARELAAIDAYHSEFGARRRYSFENHNMVVGDLKQYGQGHLLGSSNVYLAMIHNLIPVGTVAHEWPQLHAALYGFKMANQMANDAWISVYQGNLGTALPDTFTTPVFLKSFSTKYAKLYDGVRQDSGNPNEFTDEVTAHYDRLKINPQFKMALYSDNLNSTDKIKAIKDHLAGRMIDRYGIGTWFSNDVGVKPLNMVIKLTACKINGEWIQTVKLSDDPKKHTGDPETIELCKNTLGIKC